MPPKKKTEAQIKAAKAKEQKKKNALKAQIKKDHEGAGAAAGEQKVKEESVIIPKLIDLKLKNVDTVSDGDCLFASLVHQYNNSIGIADQAAPKIENALTMRKVLGDFIKHHPKEFSPFISACDVVVESSSSSGNASKKAAAAAGQEEQKSEEKLREQQVVDLYAEKLSKNSEMWGGHLEIAAASTFFNVDIVVVSDSEKNELVVPMFNVRAGEDEEAAAKKEKKVWTIVYWKHKFALGAHYESTVPGVATFSAPPPSVAAATGTTTSKKESDDEDDDDDKSGDDDE